MRRTVWPLFLAALVAGAVVQLPIFAADAPRRPAARKAAVAKLDPTKVPEGKTYALLDENGSTLKRFSSGTTTSLTADCVQVNCPSTFAKDIVCWKCKERLKAKE